VVNEMVGGGGQSGCDSSGNGQCGSREGVAPLKR
jgi:hypothetical protein